MSNLAVFLHLYGMINEGEVNMVLKVRFIRDNKGEMPLDIHSEEVVGDENWHNILNTPEGTIIRLSSKDGLVKRNVKVERVRKIHIGNDILIDIVFTELPASD